MEVGFIKKLALGKGFVFIAVNKGGDVFAHANNFHPSMDWDESLQDRPVRFRIETVDGKTRAIEVRPL